MRPTLDEYFLKMAQLVATRSTCLRRAVGCVMTNHRGHVLATGYNGVAAGAHHCNESVIRTFTSVPERDAELSLFRKSGATVQACNDPPNVPLTDDPDPAIEIFPHACSSADAPSGEGLDKCEAIHAEQNALLQCRDAWAIHTCYVTTFPCMTCLKLLLNTSCSRIVYVENYAHPDAQRLWRESGRVAVKLSTS